MTIQALHQARPIAEIVSEKDPTKSYEIRIGQDLRCYCTCMSWKMGQHKFRFRNETIKSCKHLQQFMNTGMDIVGERQRLQPTKVEFQIRALLLD